jgi:eukaryotic-like serine/threonine-protein kinase
MANFINYEKGKKIGLYEIIASREKENSGETIYSGRQIRQQAEVTIIVFQQTLPDELQESFLAQTKMLMELEHPHILPVQDAGVEEHVPFLVTAKGAYQTLREICPQGCPQPLAFILPYLKDLASALDYAHQRGVFHSDLRPDNLLLKDENQLLLTGFQIEALVQAPKGQKTPVDETELPVRTERLQEAPGPAYDQYLLALLVFELLSGSAFSEKRTASSLSHKVSGGVAGINSVIVKALAKNPEQRFANTETFVNALEEVYLQSGATDPRVPVTPILPLEDPSTQITILLEAETVSDVPVTPALTQPITPALIQPVTSVLAQPSTPFPSLEATQSAWGLEKVISEDTHILKAVPHGKQKPPLRKNEETIPRRAFAVGLMSLATLGGTSCWYLLSQRLSGPSRLKSGVTTSIPATRTSVNHTNVLIFTGHLASVNAVAWSPDGKMIASASDDTYVQVFNASNGQRSVIYTGHTEEVAAVGWSPDGASIASGGEDTTIQVWRADNGSKRLIYQGHTARVNGVSWSNDSQSIVSGSEDKSVQVWNASNGSLDFNFLGHTGGVLCVGWQPNNTSVASGSWDGTLRDWATIQHGDHFASGEQIFSYDGHGRDEVSALSWSPDSSFIASAGADQTVQISNGADGTPQRPFFTEQKSQWQANPILAVAWSPDGRSIASGDANGNVSVWKVADRTPYFTFPGHKGAVNALAWWQNYRFSRRR